MFIYHIDLNPFGPSKIMKSMGFGETESKENTTAERDAGLFSRHKNPLMCPVGAFGAYLFDRFSSSNPEAPPIFYPILTGI
jgi:hypothetical protein